MSEVVAFIENSNRGYSGKEIVTINQNCYNSIVHNKYFYGYKGTCEIFYYLINFIKIKRSENFNGKR